MKLQRKAPLAPTLALSARPELNADASLAQGGPVSGQGGLSSRAGECSQLGCQVGADMFSEVLLGLNAPEGGGAGE